MNKIVEVRFFAADSLQQLASLVRRKIETTPPIFSVVSVQYATATEVVGDSSGIHSAIEYSAMIAFAYSDGQVDESEDGEVPLLPSDW